MYNNNNNNNNIYSMCNVKTEFIPEIIRATEVTPKSFRKYLSNTPGEYEVNEPNKNSHIGHCTHASKSTNAIGRIFYVEK